MNARAVLNNFSLKESNLRAQAGKISLSKCLGIKFHSEGATVEKSQINSLLYYIQ